jgi:hypothetical protein
MPLSHEDFRLCPGAIDDDQRRGVPRPQIGVRQLARDRGDRDEIVHLL